MYIERMMKNSHWSNLSFALMVLIVMFTWQAHGQEFTEKVLLNQNANIYECGIDSTGHWWALTQPMESVKQCIIDGVPYGPFDTVSAPVFSVDGTSWMFVGVRNGLYTLQFSDRIVETSNRVSHANFAFRTNQPLWLESNGADSKIIFGERIYPINGILISMKTDPSGTVLFWVVHQAGRKVLYRNGEPTHNSEEILLAGVWVNGEPFFATRNGNSWTVRLGEEDLLVNSSTIQWISLNTEGSVGAWVGGFSMAGSRAYVYSMDMVQPVEGNVMERITHPVLSPVDPLIAYRATQNGNQVVCFNSAQYPSGGETGIPFFSNDGQFMVYSGMGPDDFIAVNGKRVRTKSAAPKSETFAVDKSGEIFCWRSSTTMVLYDLYFNMLYMGKMCDEVKPVVYNRASNKFLTLGLVSGRLYLLTARPR